MYDPFVPKEDAYESPDLVGTWAVPDELIEWYKENINSKFACLGRGGRAERSR
jgi:hypothetical protein